MEEKLTDFKWNFNMNAIQQSNSTIVKSKSSNDSCKFHSIAFPCKKN